MNNIIMSGIKPELCQNLTKFGYEISKTDELNTLHSFESTHADMQCLKINDTVFVLNECKKLTENLEKMKVNIVKTQGKIGKKYPQNVLLNALYIGEKLYCKIDSIDKSVIDYCKNNSIELVNLNQGYSKCATAVIDDTFITADKGIYDTLTQNRVEGLLIEPGYIDLIGVNYGFIGGCCFADEQNVYFTGDITKHKNFDKIEELCFNKNKSIICLSQNKLYDIGGFVRL